MDVVIIEDEDLAALSLENILKRSLFNITIKVRLSSAEEALFWLKDENNEYDLIFSDIELGDGESFEIFSLLAIKKPIIFTTAYDFYAIKSFDFYAIDYLLKPYNQDRVYKAIEKYIHLENKYELKNYQLLNEFLKNISQHKSNITQNVIKNRFLVSNGNNLLSINVEDIAFFMAEGKNLFLYTHKGNSYLYDDTISNLEQQLNKEMFFKINRKYIINHKSIHVIHKYDNNRICIQLKAPYNQLTGVFVSASRNSEFRNWLNQ